MLVLHKLPQPGKRDREAVLFWRKPTGSWECSNRASGLTALKQHLDAYRTETERLGQQYERANIAEDYFTLLEALAPAQRAAQNLRTALQAAREGIPGDRDLIDLRDNAAEIARTLELLYLDTKNALDFKVAKQAEEQAKLSLESLKAAHRLNVLAAIFFPLVTLSCVFGMNLPNGLENSPIISFWLVLLTGIVLGFFVRSWVTRGKWF